MCSEDAKDAHGQTALMTACSKGHVDIAKALLKKGADKDLG